MKKIQLFLVMLLVSCLTVTAQTLSVTGKVTNSEDGAAVIGATIKVQGTRVVTVSDVNGAYKITVPAGAAKVLEISFSGMKPVTLSVPEAGTYNVTLETEALVIGEVVVTGYGTPKRAGTTVGSSVKVDGAKIAARPSSSAMDALGGQVSGLQVYQGSGDPGNPPQMRLHGVGSIGSSSTPLYVLDGVPVDAGSIVGMNPKDFESITVLKDASATSIYGSRAANGVIYMATKRGSAGAAKINFSAMKGFSSQATSEIYDNMMSTDQLFSFWEESGIKTTAALDALKNSLLQDGFSPTETTFWNTNWNDYMQKKNRQMESIDLSIQGGSKDLSYYISASQYKEQGTAIGADYKRNTIRTNLTGKANSWMKMGMNVLLSKDVQATNPNFEGGSVNVLGSSSYLMLPYYSPYDRDGKTPDLIPGLGAANPYYTSSKNSRSYTSYSVMGSAFIEIEPIERLKIRSNVGMESASGHGVAKSLPSYIISLGNGFLQTEDQVMMNTIITNTAEYSFKLEKDHQFTILLGHEGTRNEVTRNLLGTEGQTDDRMMLHSEGTVMANGKDNYSTASRLNSFFARADYTFKERYSFDASVRNDASSRFGMDNRQATFYAVGGMWNISKEQFMNDIKLLSNARIKASYGSQGNSQVGGDYSSLPLTAPTTNYDGKVGLVLASPGNPQLGWETQSKLTFGATGTLWNKLSLEVEYYSRKTSDMIINVPVAATTGFETIKKNVGAMQNNGIDINANYTILSHPDYYLGVNANFNYNKEKITELFDGLQRYEMEGYGLAYVVGSSMMFYMPIFAGIDPQTGKPTWYKPGANIDETTKDPNQVTDVFDEGLNQNTGKKRYAPIAGGFGLNGSYKGISLSADFAFVLGKYMFNGDRYFSENPTILTSYNTSTAVLDYWKAPGDIVSFPDFTKNYSMQNDTHLLENSSYLRMKNITLSYTFENSLLNKTKVIKGARVYFTGRNLLTVTNYTGVDPERMINNAYGGVPNSKQFVFGIDLTF